MLKSAKIRQYEAIFNFVKTYPYCSQDQIRAHLKDIDLTMSRRTFERIKEEMIHIGYEFVYHRSRNGYTIEHDDSPYFENMDEFIQLLTSFGLSITDLNELRRIKRHIRLTPSSIRDKEQMSLLLQACVEHRVVQFHHLNYIRGLWEQKSLEPYQLRENNGRWYLIGVYLDQGIQQLRTFGLDRIQNVKKTAKTFAYQEAFSPDAYYQNAIGLWSQKGAKPEKVLLEVDSLNWNWINSQPWHSSQKFLSELDAMVQFSLFVEVSLDLQRKIMEWAPKVRVLEPEGLREEIRGVYTAGLNNSKSHD